MRLALFDLDGTVLRGNSWQEYFWWTLRQRPGLAPGWLARLVLRRARLLGADDLRRAALQPLCGCDAGAVEVLGRRVFDERLRALIRPMARREIARCAAEGGEPVLATAAFDFLAEPVAAELGIREVVGTRLEYIGGVCQGRWLEPEPRGPAKAVAVRNHFAGRTVEWARSRAFSDDLIDRPLLALVGEPVLVAGARPAGLPAEVCVADWDAAQ